MMVVDLDMMKEGSKTLSNPVVASMPLEWVPTSELQILNYKHDSHTDLHTAANHRFALAFREERDGLSGS